MFEMNRTQSHLVDMFSIGKSYEGRPLYVLQVGERARDTRENKATCRLRQHSKYPARLLSDRKEKSPSEESRVDRLRRPRQRVDRTCLLPVVRQRGSVVIVSCDIEPLFDHSVSIAVCNDWSLKTNICSHLSRAVTEILKNTLYRSDVEHNPDVYTSSIMPLKSWLEDQSPTLTATTFNGLFFFTTEMPDECVNVKIMKGKSILYQESQPVF